MCVLTPRENAEIGELVIRPIEVQVMYRHPFRDRTIGVFPYFDMESFAVSLEVLAAEIVADSSILLGGVSDSSGFHVITS